jgi:DNA-binding transcriptional ArsR family regulator
MKSFLAITRALSDPNRVRLLCALRGGEMCVCQLTELIDLAPSTVSNHLAILHQADLVESRKKGRWVFYRLPAEASGSFPRKMLEVTFDRLKEDPVIHADRAKLDEINKIDVEELCRTKNRKD